MPPLAHALLRCLPLVAVLFASAGLVSQLASAGGLQVSENRRFLVQNDGRPFFYLADTAWQLLQRLDREEIDRYLSVRAAQQFTVIQCVILGELDGLESPNREGALPLQDLDPARPNPAYFELVDYLVDRAAARGLHVALLPTWGSHAEDKPHPLFRNYHIFTPENARQYGRWLGRRYASRHNILWMLGGDRAPTGQEAIWEALAAGLTEGAPGALMTYHTRGYSAAAQFWNEAHWLDFNLIQSGHARFSARNWQMIEREYRREPTRPVFDAEPCYEQHPVAFHPGNPVFTDYDVRKAAYWAVFAGAFGHTYGHHSVWQMYRPGQDRPLLAVEQAWWDALSAAGARQMKHLRALLESRPFLTRIPDQSLINDPGTDTDHVQVTRDGTPGSADATYIMAYLPLYRGVTIDTRNISGGRIRGWWFNPRSGEATCVGEMANEGRIDPVAAWPLPDDRSGPDWVIVIDDVAADYPPPGTAR